MTTYRVEIDGQTVWTGETADYAGKEGFPAEYRVRPDHGEIRLYVDDECIAVNTPITAEEALAIVNQRRTDLPEEVL